MIVAPPTTQIPIPTQSIESPSEEAASESLDVFLSVTGNSSDAASSTVFAIAQTVIYDSMQSSSKFSIVACLSNSINSGTHSIGKSRNHGLCEGVKEVLNFSAISFACCQFGCCVTKNLCHCRLTLNLRSASGNCSLDNPGTPVGP